MSAALRAHERPDLAARLEGPPDPESYGEVEIDAAVLAVRAWNASVQGRTLSRLLVTTEDRTSVGFPKVVAHG